MLMSLPLTIPTTAAIKSHRTYLTNRMGSISHHITPLVINSLGDEHTHTHTHAYRHSRTEAILRNHAGLKRAITADSFLLAMPILL